MDKEALEARYKELSEQFEKGKSQLLMIQGAMIEIKKLLEINPVPSA